jgi:hypothetical protein
MNQTKTRRHNSQLRSTFTQINIHVFFLSSQQWLFELLPSASAMSERQISLISQLAVAKHKPQKTGN